MNAGQSNPSGSAFGGRVRQVSSQDLLDLIGVVGGDDRHDPVAGIQFERPFLPRTSSVEVVDVAEIA